MSYITQERLKQLLHYDPETGVFTWLQSRGKAHAGFEAGTKEPGRYVKIKLDGKQFSGHRLAWLYVTGEQPESLIDHRNGDKHDNRFSNLREARSWENSQNQKTHRTNTSGVKGVCRNRRSGLWEVRCSVRGKNHYIGAFDDLELAEMVVIEFRDTHHGAFARHA